MISDVCFRLWSQSVAATLYPDRKRWSVWPCDEDIFVASEGSVIYARATLFR